MKKFALALLVSMTSVLAFPLLAYAADAATSLASPLLTSMGGTQGVGSLAVVAVVVQVLMLGINSRFGDLTGPQKYKISAVLNIVGSILALKMNGVDWITALTHSTTVAAYQTFLHQGVKQHLEEKNQTSDSQRKSDTMS